MPAETLLARLHAAGIYPAQVDADACARRRARRSSSAPPATVPATRAAAGRTQLRGLRIADSSQSWSSSTASSVIDSSVPSSRRTRSSGGSPGARASRSSASKLAGPSLTPSPLLAIRLLLPGGLAPRRALRLGLVDEPLQLLDRPVDEHLGGAVGAAERAGDLAVVHAEGEA